MKNHPSLIRNWYTIETSRKVGARWVEKYYGPLATRNMAKLALIDFAINKHTCIRVRQHGRILFERRGARL